MLRADIIHLHVLFPSSVLVLFVSHWRTNRVVLDQSEHLWDFKNAEAEFAFLCVCRRFGRWWHLCLRVSKLRWVTIFFFFISQVQETYTVHRLQTTQRKSEKLSRKNDFTSVCWEKRCYSCLTSTVIDQQWMSWQSGRGIPGIIFMLLLMWCLLTDAISVKVR